jgi:hypothetical protein
VTARPRFLPMAEILAPCHSGSVRIEHFRITASELEKRNGLWRRYYAAGGTVPRYEVAVGTWCQLQIEDVGWMWDVPDERRWNHVAVDHARGDVLVLGLGLGLILHPILRKRSVRTVRVLEPQPHVIELVRPSLRHVPGAEKLTIEETEASPQWAPPGERYDTIWCDAVAGFSWDRDFLRLAEWWMGHFARWLRPGGWIGHWAQRHVATHVLGAPDRQVSGWVPGLQTVAA